MSVEQVICCNRCRAEIAIGRVALKIEAGASQPGWPLDPESGRSDVDLCGL
jgi:hypothetical protein